MTSNDHQQQQQNGGSSSSPRAGLKKLGDAALQSEAEKRATKPGLLAKKKSEPKMNALHRMQTLIISKEENHALVFVKPSVPKTDEIRIHIEEHFNAFKVQLTSEGTLTAEDIAARGIIDKHYAALSKNAMDLNPPKRTLSEKVQEDFQKSFGIAYSDDKVLTLGQFMQISPAVSVKDLDSAWTAGKKVKLAGGLYIGRLEALEKDSTIAPQYRPLLVVNGFYAGMRADYITKGHSVLYFTVEWKEKDLSWKDFRGLVVGATDPVKAHPDSLRGKMLKHWKDLGLAEAPSVQNNCVHASAGPIEAMRERATWIEMPIEKDPFAQVMLDQGIPLDMIKAWADNAQVTVGDKSGPAFDVFEDVDSGEVVKMALQVLKKDNRQPSDDDETGNDSPAAVLKKLPNGV